MANNPEWEIEAFKEGAIYFDEDPDKNNGKYKHTMFTNTALWWFRKNKKPIRIFTRRLADIDYLYDLVHKDTINTVIYYNSISPLLDIEEIKQHYADGDVKFVKIDFDPNEVVSFKTRGGKAVNFETLFLANDNTILFDTKELGAKKELNGNRRIYRIKGKTEFNQIKLILESKLKTDI